MILPRYFLLVIFLILVNLPGCVMAQSPTLPTSVPQEMRGLWVVRDSITSPAAITNVVELAKAHHFNALFVQVRGRGDAFYQSALEPRAEELAGQPLTFDPLAQIIQQGHAAGLQVHAWLNTFYVWDAGRLPYSSAHVVNAHPDWLALNAAGHFQLFTNSKSEGAYLSPANQDASKHIHDIFLDVTNRYDVDGIHFDYVRYDNPDYDYSDAALFLFRMQMHSLLTPAQSAKLDARANSDRIVYPRTFHHEWEQFRRDQVTNLVEAISRDIKAAKPWVIVSAAVFADSKDAFTTRGQDWKTWLKRGYLDAVVPMAYGSDTSQVAAEITDAVACAHAAGRYAYAGIGSWHIPPESTILNIGAARLHGAQGVVLFSYGGITQYGTSTAYLNKVAGVCYSSIAAAPSMPWVTPRPTAMSAQPNTRAVQNGG